jgi:hypothetical protein
VSLFCSYYHSPLMPLSANSARKLDDEQAAKIVLAKSTGILKTTNNMAFDRLARNLNRAKNSSRKKNKARERQDEHTRIREEIANHQKATKDLQQQLQTTTTRRAQCSAPAESSSSGRVASVRKESAKARKSATPYPQQRPEFFGMFHSFLDTLISIKIYPCFRTHPAHHVSANDLPSSGVSATNVSTGGDASAPSGSLSV